MGGMSSFPIIYRLSFTDTRMKAAETILFIPPAIIFPPQKKRGGRRRISNPLTIAVFKSQEEALADGTHYTFCVLCTKCLPDVRSNAKVLAPTIESGQVSTFLLIQVRGTNGRMSSSRLRLIADDRTAWVSRKT